MSFRTALSGINAATADLGATSNNIANVATVGFKESRAEFGDVFAASIYGVGRNTVGAGVRLTGVTQQFTQGSIEFTDRNLDLAISGQGFFTLSQNGATVYSRAGNFGLDRDGYVVSPQGARLQVYPPDGEDGFQTGRLSDIQLRTTDSAPQMTTSVTLGVNLPANQEVPTVTPFDPEDANSYSYSGTSVTVYDSLGVGHVQTTYFVKTANPNEWEMHTYIDDQPVGGAVPLAFSDTGELTNPANGQIVLPPFTPTNGAGQLDITLDIAGTTQFGERYSLNDLHQDGFAAGRLIGIEVSQEGVVYARYTNGEADPLGQVALTTFSNPQGLQSLGDNQWAETYDSGTPRRGQANTSDFGVVESGALEASNVDLTEQLVNMIVAQRNFQANAQMISTQDQVTQTVINIR